MDKLHVVWRVAVLLVLLCIAVTHVIQIRQTGRLLEAVREATGVGGDLAEVKRHLAEIKDHLADIEANTWESAWAK